MAFTIKFETIKSASELDTGKSVIQLYYGPAGGGKTWYGGAADLVISIGEGDETLRSKFFQETTKCDPRILTIRESFDPRTGLFKKAEGFDNVTDALDWALTEDRIRSVTIDDATFLSNFARNKAAELNQDSGKSKSLASSKAAGYLSVAVQDFGEEMKMLAWFLATYISQFRAKEKDLIILAHDRHIYKKADPDKMLSEKVLDRILPGFTGQTFPDQISAFFDLVWHAEGFVSNGKFYGRARTISDVQKLITKTRWGGIFDETIINPDFRIAKKAIEAQVPYKSLLATKK